MIELEPMDIAGRADRLRSRFELLGVDGLVVSSSLNVRWLTGFTGSNATVLVTAEELVVITDGRYAQQLPDELDASAVRADVVIGVDPDEELGALGGLPRRLGLEADHISWARQRRIADRLERRLVPTEGVMLEMRAVKDAGEVARMRAAAHAADEALAQVVPLLGTRPTERTVAHELDRAMRAAGATGPAYETIVAAGPNAALPHARPTDRVIEPGDPVIVDVGAVVDGYRSDMTRSFVVGEPDDEQRERLDATAAAQAAGVAAVRPGVACRAVDAACRDLLRDLGFAENFVHGTGHGVGLDIHELPRVSSRSDDTLAEGMVVTVEPGVYFPGSGGVRWEDLLLVTSDGCEPLTRAAKSPGVDLADRPDP